MRHSLGGGYRSSSADSTAQFDSKSQSCVHLVGWKCLASRLENTELPRVEMEGLLTLQAAVVRVQQQALGSQSLNGVYLPLITTAFSHLSSVRPTE